MVRKGKDLEETVSLLHKILSKDEYEITSPDYIADKITGQLREVDISIKATIGSVSIIIIIECRDRKSKEDSMWIEQLVTKCKDLNVQKVIAVSSNDFTEPAKAKANHHGIETRTLNRITVEDVKSWFLCESFEFLISHSHITKITSIEVINYGGDGFKFDGNEQIFITNGEELSLNEVFDREIIRKQPKIFDDVLEEGTKIHKKINFIDNEKLYTIKIDENDPYQLKCFSAEFYLWKELREIPISEIIRYSNSNGTFIEGVKYPIIEVDGATYQFSFFKEFE
ncbi:hypothetical protein HNV12_10575 [Methanococcoides sp. SA1]|nr:hypothetical protein [Methanococcoides sp. SA1]